MERRAGCRGLKSKVKKNGVFRNLFFVDGEQVKGDWAICNKRFVREFSDRVILGRDDECCLAVGKENEVLPHRHQRGGASSYARGAFARGQGATRACRGLSQCVAVVFSAGGELSARRRFHAGTKGPAGRGCYPGVRKVEFIPAISAFSA
jgi:hypothetical protein